MIEKPLPPGDYECCESGCDRCVWDIYREDLQEWEAAQKAANANPEPPQATPTISEQKNS
ncbi:oxidoreductase-like domain-containing protein [Parathalassolituus penaei]|uniref:Oxidoreductase-like domain-containing protein n=1 Tax=Parathalassolituus penaei TaxID=2997323 RepID=A0A9X3EGG4_9GAMM|nr:oxidoreductase-like domain-containing protein [Parathalassolituus penaei]MCY0966776.1 hypothetical protein [Parathalassolituus penaei]